MESFGREETPKEKVEARKIAELLGAEEPIYIGDVFPEITPENLSEIREFVMQVREIRNLPEPPTAEETPSE